MIKIYKIFLVFFCILFSEVNAEFSICDSGDINYNGETNSQICNGGNEYSNISEINSFSGESLDLDAGYWGNLNQNFKTGDIVGILHFGYFNSNTKTVINSINPDYNFPIGYFGSNISANNFLIDIENNYVVGFFNSHMLTKISNTKSQHTFPVGFLSEYKFKKVSLGIKKEEKDVYYRDFFIDIFLDNINQEVKNKYERDDLNIFIISIIDFLLDNSDKGNHIISDVSQKRIKLEVKESDFPIRLNKLVNNMNNINTFFKKYNSVKQRLIILDYYSK